jgi:hypothetical protein
MEIKILRFCITYLLLFAAASSPAQQKFNLYLSNSGKDANPGTSAILPRKTLLATAPLLAGIAYTQGFVSLGLQQGDIFNETLNTSYPIVVGTYSFKQNDNDFAILNGAKEFDSGWTQLEKTNFTYEQDIPYTGFTGYGMNGIGSYSYIYVTEVDKSLEATAPFTARKPLQFVTSLSDLENTPGSFYSPINTTENPKKMFVHTSDGSSPNGNARFGYEVTVRDCAINSTYQAGNRFENLWVHGYGGGIGMLPGGSGSYYNKIVFGPGAGIHHLVLRSGTIDHSLFLPGSQNTSDFAVVFYDVEGLERHCTISNSIFLDINSPVYAHTSLGTNFGAVELDDVVALNTSQSASGFMFTSNTDSVILNNVYAANFLCGYNYGKAGYAAISNSYFKDVRFGIAYSPQNPVTAYVDNVFIKTIGPEYTTGIYVQDNTKLKLTHSIIHINSTYANYWPNAGAFVYGAGKKSCGLTMSGNIFICDIFPSATLMAATVNTDDGAGTSTDKWNNNVYILLKGKKINWTVTNAATNGGNAVVQDFEGWKQQSGQDKNSLFFDLRNDPRGLKAIFADPDNGNYDLANTPEGMQIAALQAGMTNPLSCFLQKPSYEDAAAYVKNNKVLSINTCRNPCLQNTIRVNNTFNVSILHERQVNLEWNISEQQNIAQYEIQRAIGNSVFQKLASLPVVEDSVYSFVDNIQPGINYQYRLVVVASAGGRCYSQSRSVKITDARAFSVYPNPSTGKIFVSMNGYVGKVDFIIFNSQGQIIMKQEAFSLYSPQELDLTQLPKGIYSIEATTSSGIYSQKLLLQ